MDAVLIAGPTASGKSALALGLARRLGSAVVNADSMQVYRDLRVLTSRPTPREEEAAPHLLFGHVDGAQNHSVGRWAAEAAALLAARRPGEPPLIFAGGTGLYFKALTDGLSAIPPVPDAIRAAVRSEVEGRPTEALHRDLSSRDPEAAGRLGPGDRQRVVRALEVWAATGRSIVSFQGSRRPGPLAGRPTVRLFLAPDRAALRDAIDRRFVAMVEGGALDEVGRLAARRLDPALPVMRAHGVPGLLDHLRSGGGLDDAVRRGQADTRAYAKRQWTWFRHQMEGWTSLSPAEAWARLPALANAAARPA